MLLAVGMATLLGLAFRGNLRRFSRPVLSRNGLLAFGVLAQATALVARHPGVHAGWLGFGAAALVLYALRNRGRPGLLLAAGGLAVNVVAIVVNWGMPVDLDAAARAGVPSSRLDLAADPLRTPVTADTVLPWLGESIPLALPWRPAVASPGDLLAAAGAGVFVFTGLTGRGRRAPLAPVATAKQARRRSQEDPDATGGAEFSPADAPPQVPAEASIAAVHVAGPDDAMESRKTGPGAVNPRGVTASAAIRSTASRSAAIHKAGDRGGSPEQGDRKAAKQARRAQRKVAGRPDTVRPDASGGQPDGSSPGAAADQRARRREKKSKRQERKATRSTSAAGGESASGTDPAALSRRSEPRSSPAEDG